MDASRDVLPRHCRQGSMKRVIAVDWSGARTGAKRKIWLAEVRDGRLQRLESGRSRRELVEHLIDEAAKEPDMVVGLDFAFSFPRWFAEERGAQSIGELWDLVDEHGEEWLRNCQCPFWGKAGCTMPRERELYRLTEQRASEEHEGVNPKSVFQIGGGGAVGTGSIRGMPYLVQLREAGFSVWPFEVAPTRLVLEIYPRLLTGPVNRSDFDEREKYLAKHCPEIDCELACKAASSEDAFDAAVSAVVMSRHVEEIGALTASQNPTELIEGNIWWPPYCPFCHVSSDSVIAESCHALAIADEYPVNPGHTLVIPRTHSRSLFTHSSEAQADIWHLVANVRDHLQSRLNPDGFNIGINDGSAGGQTVNHAHIHVIPRFDGDVADPRGGIRWVLPESAAYWDR